MDLLFSEFRSDLGLPHRQVLTARPPVLRVLNVSPYCPQTEAPGTLGGIGLFIAPQDGCVLLGVLLLCVCVCVCVLKRKKNAKPPFWGGSPQQQKKLV